MSQIQEVRCLTKEQIETVLKNLSSILHLKNLTKIFDGKPVFSKENEEKYGLYHITKFADNYSVYKAEFSDDYYTNVLVRNDITYKFHATTNTKMHGVKHHAKRSNSKANDPERSKFMYFITLEATKFDKLNISACSWFYHLFEDKINRDGINGRPQVYISPAFVVTDSLMAHVPTNIIPCLYRFVSLAELYPMIGSTSGLYGMTYDYTIIPHEESYNGREYPYIYDYDVIVKILNAVTGDIIQCKRVLSEESPYGEYYRRIVMSTMDDIYVISPSGLSFGYEE